MLKQYENGTYVLSVKTTCPYCHMAVELLEEAGLPYKKIIIGSSSPIQEEIKEAFGWKTVPIVFFKRNEKFPETSLFTNMYELIGGYTDLEKIING